MTEEEKQRHYAHVRECRRKNEQQRRDYEALVAEANRRDRQRGAR